MSTKTVLLQNRIRSLATLTLKLEDLLAEALPIVENSHNFYKDKRSLTRNVVKCEKLSKKIRKQIKEKLDWDARNPTKSLVNKAEKVFKKVRTKEKITVWRCLNFYENSI